MRKGICTVISAALLCGLFIGCTGAQGGQAGEKAAAGALTGRDVLVGDIPVSFPLTKQPASMNILITGYGDIDPEEVFVWKTYEGMTGVDVHWTAVAKDKRAEAVHTALTNHQNIDLILRCKLSAGRLTQYGESGLILDLAKEDLLKTYAPNCWAYLAAHPDTLASVMNPDGSIYALPQVNSGAEPASSAASCRTRRVTVPPSGVNLTALERMLTNTCVSRTLSPMTAGCGRSAAVRSTIKR